MTVLGSRRRRPISGEYFQNRKLFHIRRVLEKRVVQLGDATGLKSTFKKEYYYKAITSPNCTTLFSHAPGRYFTGPQWFVITRQGGAEGGAVR
jgi:hypothetical protein